MKFYKLTSLFLLLGFLTVISACEEETTSIGSSLTTGEVVITVDTFYFQLQGKALPIENFDSKSGILMMGNIENKEYGKLNCSFVTRLMCAPKLDVPDTLFYPERVDSCKLILGAKRSEIVGDSMAPQRFTVYELTKQLPSSINNLFNPEGYYDPASPLASRSYTLSQLGSSDSAFYNNSYIELSVNLPQSLGKEIFEKYKNEPEIFQWPQTMAENFLKGLYVKSTYGKGNIANIESAYVAVFYYNLAKATVVEDGDTITKEVHVNNVTFPFAVSPEVLSSNNITYQPSEQIIEKNTKEDGEIIITTPGGYLATFEFPAQTLIERYKEQNVHLSTVNELTLYLPAENYGSSWMSVAENILMIKSSEYQDFFEKNRIPDNVSSFTGVYDSAKGRYYFASLRNYFLDLLKKDEITKEDLEFTIVPVEIETETTSNYYGSGTTYITKCTPFSSKPTMTLVKTNEALVTFSFSTQMID